MNDLPAADAPNPTKRRKVSLITGGIATVLIPINFGVWMMTELSIPFMVLAALQLVLGIWAMVTALIHVFKDQPSSGAKVGMVLWSIFACLVGLGGPAGLFLAVIAEGLAGMGGAWGRPLRIEGRVVHPSLREGADWTEGDRPDASGLDLPTRRALEALWLHDAQKEHASVPAFSRISWMLSAVGAPPELLMGAHHAAMQEIDHAKRCFALAAGYGGRHHTVEAMPDLLLTGLELRGDPFATLATESLEDGCLLEDFNADVAGRCAAGCEDPATRDVLQRITVEEREHAEFSWDLLAWAIERAPEKVVPAIEKTLAGLDRVPRPTAASAQKRALVDAADRAQLRAHGRIPDAEWAAMWSSRLVATRERVERLLHGEPVMDRCAE